MDDERASAEDGDHRVGYANRMLGLLAVGTLVGIGGQLIVAPLLPSITAELGLSPFQAGLALSMMWGLAAVGQYPAGRFADATTRKTVLVAGLIGFLLGTLVLGVATSIPLFLAGVALIGVGGGLYPPAVFVTLADLFTNRRGRAFGVASAAQDLGGALAPVVATAVLLVAGWRFAFLPIAALLAVLMVLVHQWSREAYAFERVSLQLGAAISRLTGTWQVRRLMIATALFATVWQGTVSFLPTLLRADLGFSSTLANAAFSLLFLVGMIGRLAAGTSSDRFGPHTVGLATIGIALLGLVVLVAAPAIAIALVGVLLFGFGLAAYWPVVQVRFMNRFPESTAGRDFGAMRSTYILFGSLGPAYVGFVAERASYRLAFLGFALVTVTCAALLATIGRDG